MGIKIQDIAYVRFRAGIRPDGNVFDRVRDSPCRPNWRRALHARPLTEMHFFM